MPLPIKKQNDKYSYSDYLSWGEDERIELLDGRAVMMAPPTRKHQGIRGELYRQIANYLEGKNCKIYAAPFSVRLFQTDDDTDDDVKTVFEPDISVICDKNKLDDKGCKGAPDMIIEILSPSTASYDALTKLNKYQQAGVREYWIVDPIEESLRVYLLDGEFYKTPGVYKSSSSLLKVRILEDCYIDLEKVFR